MRSRNLIACLLFAAVGSISIGLTVSRSQGDEPTPTAKAKVELQSLNWSQLQAKVLTNPKAKYVLVDAWATWCGTCKENFPHLVEMHKKYAEHGLSVVSLSMDDPTDKKAVAAALEFLKEKDATFTNVLLDEESGVGFEKLEVQAIPAVFLYDAKGKEIRRFTLDDVDNQFTYDDVEKAVREVLRLK
jgi:thiol-disulfide isomerase/thioredoxin